MRRIGKTVIATGLVLILLTVGCSSVPKAGSNTAVLKRSAEKFCLSIVKAYFSEDCDRVYSAISDAIFLLEDNKVIFKEGNQEKICQSVKRAVRQKEKSFKDYDAMYEAKLYTPKEFREAFNIVFPEIYTPDPSDLLFVGALMKAGKLREQNFIWDDMFIFMVRIENKGWKIKAFPG